MDKLQRFVALDLETTGFSPRCHDRVIEIGLTRFSDAGEVLATYSTLVNPSRDIGNTSIHGITAADIASAPSFSDVVGDVLSFLDGAVLVGHNAQFDLRFLSAELSQVGVILHSLDAICTLQLSRLVDPELPSRKLQDLCDYFDIEVSELHSALHDSTATAKLFVMLSSALKGRGVELSEYFSLSPTAIEQSVKCNFPCMGRVVTRADALLKRREGLSYIADLISKLPTMRPQVPGVDNYLEIIDRVLEDRLVSPEEANELFEVATAFSLTRGDVVDAHLAYLRALSETAFADGQLSSIELKDLQSVAGLLSIEDTLAGSIIEAASKGAANTLCEPKPEETECSKLVGKSVCFTGELHASRGGRPISRNDAQQLAESAGLCVKRTVSKSLDILVVADPNSMSGKAQKARLYKTHIIAECVFWRLIGVQVD